MARGVSVVEPRPALVQQMARGAALRNRGPALVHPIAGRFDRPRPREHRGRGYRGSALLSSRGRWPRTAPACARDVGCDLDFSRLAIVVTPRTTTITISERPVDLGQAVILGMREMQHQPHPDECEDHRSPAARGRRVDTSRSSMNSAATTPTVAPHPAAVNSSIAWLL
jgi:hypothetical protein